MRLVLNRVPFRQVVGLYGAPPGPRGRILEIIGPTTAKVDLHYQYLTPYPERVVSALARVIVTSWSTDELQVGDEAMLPAVVEFIAVDPPTYRAVTAEELRPYLKGQKIVGLEPAK